MNGRMLVSSSPHIHSGESTKKIMWSVFLALIPAGAWGIYCHGIKALYLIIASTGTCLLTEAVILRLRGRPATLTDESAALTGLLLAYNVTPQLPVWVICAGAVFAIAIGKQVFGGLGRNIFNPALVGRAFLMASWPAHMVTFSNPRWQVDAVTSATPLDIIKQNLSYSLPSYTDLLIGNRGGCIGEACIVALLMGAAFLLYRRYISLHIPISYIGTFGILSWAFMGEGFFSGDWLLHILSGGLILGAFFMATDYVTSPNTGRGKIVAGILCGTITFAIRRWGGYPEGVSYAILIMNAATPIIDRHTKPRRFGTRDRQL